MIRAVVDLRQPDDAAAVDDIGALDCGEDADDDSMPQCDVRDNQAADRGALEYPLDGRRDVVTVACVIKRAVDDVGCRCRRAAFVLHEELADAALYHVRWKVDLVELRLGEKERISGRHNLEPKSPDGLGPKMSFSNVEF